MSVSKINGQTILASDVTITNNELGNATFYIPFVSVTSGTDNLEIDSSGLTYNALTNTLTLGAAGIGTLNGVATKGGGFAAQGRLATAALSPFAGTNYYGGGAASAALSTTVQSRRLYMPKAGTIKACYGYFFQTASASGNLGTLAINVNNGGYTTVGTAAHNVASTVYSNTGLSISVAQGAYIEFRWTAPATTAPTNVTSEFIVYVE
jgi:hypothetical protein